MINKFETIGIFLCIAIMVIALMLLGAKDTKQGTLLTDSSQAITITSSTSTKDTALENSVKNSMGINGEVKKLVITDATVGTGDAVKTGDTVTVNYIGTLESGAEFDNSYKRGTPFSFTVGEGRVIKGWDQGLVGMKVGGKRILVIPSDLAYGASGAGPIPANATLLFSIELLKIGK